MNDSKICRRCGTDKPLVDFRDHRSTHPPKDGKQSNCRPCENTIARENYTTSQRGPQAPVVHSAGPWTKQAKCLGVDAGLFFPGQGEPTQPAKNICAECPVRLQCLEYALANNEDYGVWGGLSSQQRQRIRVRRNNERRQLVTSS